MINGKELNDQEDQFTVSDVLLSENRVIKLILNNIDPKTIVIIYSKILQDVSMLMSLYCSVPIG